MEKPNVLQGLANPANYDFPEGLCLPSSFQEGKNRRKKRGGFYLINDFVLVPLGSPLSQSKDQRTYAPFENHGRNNPDNPEAEDNSQQVPEHDADNPHAEHGGDGGELRVPRRAEGRRRNKRHRPEKRRADNRDNQAGKSFKGNAVRRGVHLVEERRKGKHDNGD